MRKKVVKKEKDEVVILMIPPALKRKLRADAKAAHMSMSALIRQKIAESDEIKALYRNVTRLSKNVVSIQAQQGELFAKMRERIGEPDED